jgi:hypothetical protein
MADKVLYFPYIRVPKNVWFTRVLLYWDEVGSIVPSEYIHRPENLGIYMRELVQAELIKPVLPSHYTHEIPRFREAFLEMVDQNQIITDRRGLALERNETFRIHIEKSGDALTEALYDRGLARPAEYPWFEVEKLTADLFMAYLASVLGKLKDLQMDPITDRADALSVFSKSPQNILDPITLVDQLRISVLEGVLPAPAGEISVYELANFKDRHSDLLPRFRRRIESFLINAALISDKNLRDYKVRLFRDELIEGRNEIQARMHERKWPRILFGTVCGLVAAAIPGAEAIATGNITSAVKALPGIVTAIYSAFSGATNQNEILRSPLAYAALVQERLS